MHGRGPSFLCVVSRLSTFRRQFCIKKSRWEFKFCPLSGIKKLLLLGGCFSIITMLISIRNSVLVLCREVVRFLEGPLSIGGSTVDDCTCIQEVLYVDRKFYMYVVDVICIYKVLSLYIYAICI